MGIKYLAKVHVSFFMGFRLYRNTYIIPTYKEINEIHFWNIVAALYVKVLEVLLATPAFNRGFPVSSEGRYLLDGHNIRPRCQFLFIKLPHHKQIMLGQHSRLWDMGLLVVALRRLVVFGMNVPILQVMNHVCCFDLEAPGFLPAVQAGDKAALQKKEAGLFADMTNAVHLIFCHVDGVLL